MPRSQTTPAALAIAALVCAMLGACGDETRVCYPGEYRGCTCGDGRAGYGACAYEGLGFGACDCDSGTPGLIATTAGSGGGGGAGGGVSELLAFLAACDEDAQCETGLCHPFNAKGPHCSQPCSGASDCPPPSAGCSNMGVCKPP